MPPKNTPTTKKKYDMSKPAELMRMVRTSITSHPKRKLASTHYGMRPGSFDSLLRMSNALVFGRTTPVRMQGAFKKKMWHITEHIIVRILKEARVRREENNGKRIQAQNIVGAFIAWANVVNPLFIREFEKIYSLSDVELHQHTEDHIVSSVKAVQDAEPKADN